MSNKINALEKYSKFYDKSQFLILHEEMSFAEYIDLCQENPRLARNAFQYVYDMIISKGVTTFERYRKTYKKYNFFTDSETPVFGLEDTLARFVSFEFEVDFSFFSVF